ncbi:MAG: DeoR family transcriptional regulator [Candidatus Niyogibacteria bacterium]|nr:DeoR family transcriptional regulator [Candidatus Niyogibacteria bacterium]
MDPRQYIQERTQKITEALYRVTDLFSDKEPIKWLLRKKGIDIFNCLSFLDDNSPDRRLKNIEIVSGSISSILRVLDIASAGAFISAVNFEVLQREYRALVDFINHSKKDILPSPTAFLSDSVLKIVSSENNSKESPDKGHSNGQKGQVGINNFFNGQALIVKDIKKINNNKENSNNSNNLEIKNNVKIKSQIIANTNTTDTIKIRQLMNNNKKNVPYNDDNDEIEIKFNRQKKILEFVKNNGWVGAREVSVMFNKNISEKTVQRDLIAMADSGILRKAGDKRWRRYAVV